MIYLIILAIVQGLTEFLPISSSGHLLLFYDILGMDESRLLSILFHIATLLSVVIYYRKDIWMLIKNPLCRTNRKILTTTIITCAFVLLFKPLIDATFNTQYLFIFFLITAILLIISDYVNSKNMSSNNKVMTNTTYISNNITDLNISYKSAFLIGLTQGIACIPGISRSGSTIAIARILGVGEDATKYSFLISIPIIIASLILELIGGGNLGENGVLSVSISMIVCFVVGLISIHLMTMLVSKNRLIYFSYYLMILSAVLIFF